MASLHRVKRGDTSRVLTVKDLGIPSVTKPLVAIRESVEEIVRSLLSKGFLVPAGRRRFSCTPDGNSVKHRFDSLRNHLRICGLLPSMGSDPIQVEILRDYMRRLCEGTWD